MFHLLQSLANSFRRFPPVALLAELIQRAAVISTNALALISDSYTNLVILLQTNATLEFLGDTLQGHAFASHHGHLEPATSSQCSDRYWKTARVSASIETLPSPRSSIRERDGILASYPMQSLIMEAEWVSHILNCLPTLHEQATKVLP